MLISYKLGQTSIILRVKIPNSSVSDNSGVTGLTSSSTGLSIATIADNEASATIYTSAASHIQTIATLGTFAAPSASSCRFAEVDATNHPGIFEIQLDNSRYAVSNSKSLLVTIKAITALNVTQVDVLIPLVQLDPYTALSIDGSGRVLLQPTQTGVTIPTVTNVTNGVIVSTNNDKTGYALTASLPSVDGSGRVLLQPTQSGVTIPTVTDITNGVIISTNNDKTGYSLASDPSGVTTLLSRLSSTRASNLDNLDASISSVNTNIANLNNLSALANLFGSQNLIRPSSGSLVYPFILVIRDSEGHLIDLDTDPTLTATNSAGSDRSSNLSSITHSATGEYKFTYTVASSATNEGLAFTASGTVSSSVRKAYFNATVTDADSLSSLAAIKTQTDKLTFDGSNNIAVDKTGYSLTSTYDVPSNFSSLNIDGSGKILLQATQTGVTIPIVTTLTNKTGFSLASTGLDSIDQTIPSGDPDTFPKRLNQLFNRFFRKTVKDNTGKTIKMYAADNTTLLTTQIYTDDGASNETLNKAT